MGEKCSHHRRPQKERGDKNPHRSVKELPGRSVFYSDSTQHEFHRETTPQTKTAAPPEIVPPRLLPCGWLHPLSPCAAVFPLTLQAAGARRAPARGQVRCGGVRECRLPPFPPQGIF